VNEFFQGILKELGNVFEPVVPKPVFVEIRELFCDAQIAGPD
jgi:hypothetical protein